MHIPRPAVLLLIAGFSACSGSGEGEPPVESAAEQSEAEALLTRSIAYHDPAAEWEDFRGTLSLEEVRPDGSSRTAQVGLDVTSGGFEYRVDADGSEVVKRVTRDGCVATVDGGEPDEAAIESHRLGCEAIERSRNYYLYLWGLPMKLRDPGTLIDPSVERTEFEGQAVDQIRVTYDADVGGDIWYFYFEPTSARMIGYRFYHDESVNDGEYITLEGEHVVSAMRIPARRRWFVNADDRFLGEDVLAGVGPYAP